MSICLYVSMSIQGVPEKDTGFLPNISRTKNSHLYRSADCVKGPNAFGLAFCDPKGLSEQLWKINLSFSEAHFILQISQHAENGYSFKIL